MKKFYYCIAILGISLCACQGFLDEASKGNVIIPENVYDYKELLVGEAYHNDIDLHRYLDLMTDDVSEFGNSASMFMDVKLSASGYYTWQKDPELTIEHKRINDVAWESYYHKILISNIVIDKINKGDIKGQNCELDDLKAEAYFLKALSYFMLVNLYGEPYIYELRNSEIGVPINNEVGVSTKKFNRESLRSVYKVMTEYIMKAIDLFENSNLKKSKYRINKYAAYVLASRILLYQHRYREAISISTKVISLKPELCDLNTTRKDFFINIDNPEILWCYGQYDYSQNFNMSKISGFRASDDLIKLYSISDLRLINYYRNYEDNYIPYKWNRNGEIYDHCIRISEAYLNRAEAYCNMSRFENAIKDIYEIRKNRIFGEYRFHTIRNSEVLNVIKEERRRELCFENHRWFDLRRWRRPGIKHSYTDKNGETKIYILEKDDAAYTLQVPKCIRDINSKIKLIDRPTRNHVIESSQN